MHIFPASSSDISLSLLFSLFIFLSFSVFPYLSYQFLPFYYPRHFRAFSPSLYLPPFLYLSLADQFAMGHDRSIPATQRLRSNNIQLFHLSIVRYSFIQLMERTKMPKHRNGSKEGILTHNIPIHCIYIYIYMYIHIYI